MRIYYECHYDGNECDKVTPKLDKTTIIEPEKDGYSLEGWKICTECERNYSIGSCRGRLCIGK